MSATISKVKESHVQCLFVSMSMYISANAMVLQWSAWYYAVRSENGRWHKFNLKRQERCQSLPLRHGTSMNEQ
jgi:hypothetical protein